jgi:hypothetical protein
VRHPPYVRNSPLHRVDPTGMCDNADPGTTDDGGGDGISNAGRGVRHADCSDGGASIDPPPPPADPPADPPTTPPADPPADPPVDPNQPDPNQPDPSQPGPNQNQCGSVGVPQSDGSCGQGPPLPPGCDPQVGCTQQSPVPQTPGSQPSSQQCARLNSYEQSAEVLGAGAFLVGAEPVALAFELTAIGYRAEATWLGCN